MTLVLVYDGGCPFCRHFALRSELVGGLPDLEIRDGRSDHPLRAQLNARGLDLACGAVLLEGDQAWHGSAAIAELCRRLKPSDPLLALLGQVFAAPPRARQLYPLLLWARRMALHVKGLPEDPDSNGAPAGLRVDQTAAALPQATAAAARSK
jgi:predicted DCC family thiol-disulfide oxidoreductase YuxK